MDDELVDESSVPGLDDAVVLRKPEPDQIWSSAGEYQKQKGQHILQAEEVPIEELESLIFKGLLFWINGHTTPPSDDLQLLIRKNGGKAVTASFISDATHMIHPNLNQNQVNQIKKLKKPNKTVYYVTEKWVLDSIEKKARLPEHLYLPEALKTVQVVGGVASGQPTLSGFVQQQQQQQQQQPRRSRRSRCWPRSPWARVPSWRSWTAARWQTSSSAR